MSGSKALHLRKLLGLAMFVWLFPSVGLPAPTSADRNTCGAPAVGDQTDKINACTRILEDTGDLPGDRALAFTYRAIAYSQSGDDGKANADFAEAFKTDPNNADIYLGRGLASILKGRVDEAAPDVDRALAIDPKSLPALNVSGELSSLRGDYKVALNRFDAALASSPNDIGPLIYRAVARFYSGSFDGAVSDLIAADQTQAGGAYPVLWLEMFAKRTGASGKFAKRAERKDAMTWQAPLLQMYLGKVTPAQALDAAHHANPPYTQGQLCASNFFVAEFFDSNGKTSDAIPLYQAVTHDCLPLAPEQIAARSELKSHGITTP